MFIAYAYFLYDSMLSHIKDDYKSIKTTNIMHSMAEEEDHDRPHIDVRNKTRLIKRSNEFYLNDLDFMPVYEIKSMNQEEIQKFDIFQLQELGFLGATKANVSRQSSVNYHQYRFTTLAFWCRTALRPSRVTWSPSYSPQGGLIALLSFSQWESASTR